MESNGKNVVYVRRGEGEKKPADWKEDGKGLRRGGDDGRGGKRRLDGKLIRKRGLKDVSLGEKKRQLSNKSGKNSDHMDDSPPGRGPGRYKSMDRRWKDASSDGEKRKGRVLNLKRSRDRDGSGSAYEERKEIVGRGKRSVRHFKGTKPADKGFSSSKLKVRVGMNSSESPGKVKHLDATDNNADGRIKKSAAEPPKKRRHRLILDENSDDDDYYPKPAGVKKDANPSRSPEAEGEDEALNEVDEEGSPDQQQATAGINSQGVRKSSRVPKKKVLEDFEDDVPDAAGLGVAEAGGSPEQDEKLEGGAESDSSDEKEMGGSGAEVSDSDPDLEYLKAGLAKAKLKRPKASQDTLPVSHGKTRSAPALTARQRTMQLGKEGDSNLGLNLIEFPAGLTTLSRRGTQKLTLEERQVKKAEAANRRKQVVERAAHELQATAIQKILGQDSSRKRKEERLQRQREEMEQEKKAASKGLPSNRVRWTIGPQGQTVSWAEDVVLPNIFSAPSSGYPPCRQKCAAPSCTNPYNYRDSKSNLPLCSLRCYDTMRPAAAALVS